MKWRRPKPEQRRADSLAIAVLEYELLGIEPEPGTAAAFAVGLQGLRRCGTPARQVTGPYTHGE